MDSPDFYKYVQRVKQENLHPQQVSLLSAYTKVPLENINHLIFYGPSGIGKYSQALYFISAFSSTELKYEKKITVEHEVFKTSNFRVRVSDIHYEIDMALMGCVSKSLWHTIYSQILEIVLSKPHKTGIILCRNFHGIHNELLDIFYSYLQHKCTSHAIIKFIFITEAVSFIPDTMLNCCDIISFSKPTKIAYSRILKNNISSFDVNTNTSLRTIQQNLEPNEITNMQLTQMSCKLENGNALKVDCDLLQHSHALICKRLFHYLDDIQTIDVLEVRNVLYEILIYNLDLHECIWDILQYAVGILKKNNDLNRIEKQSNLLNKTAQFFKLYNKNYRPIYHLECLFFNFVDIIYKA
jgi:DNA polymerase III delta prime subunit